VVEIAVFPERLDNFQNSTPLIPEIWSISLISAAEILG
jgi:hypothetical protein